MGCDIHFYVEKRVDGKWVTADKWTEDKYELGAMAVDHDDQFLTSRNYDLFGILANVRNGYGFAGTPTGAGYVPMFAPRGVPNNASSEYKAVVERYGADGHSHSWASVAEIMAYDWTQKTTKTGWVNPEQRAEWKSRGKPQEWASMIAGGNVKHLSEAEFSRAWAAVAGGINPYWNIEKNLAAFVTELGGGTPVCEVSWPKFYYEAGAELLGEVLPRLWRLGKPDDVRIVFFFDN